MKSPPHLGHLGGILVDASGVIFSAGDRKMFILKSLDTLPGGLSEQLAGQKALEAR